METILSSNQNSSTSLQGVSVSFQTESRANGTTTMSSKVSYINDIMDIPIVKVSLIVLYSLVGVLCVVGNSIVLVVMARCPHLRTRTNIFLLNLAVADLSVGIVCIIPNLTFGIIKTWIAGPFGNFLCKFFNFGEEFNLTVTVMLLLLIAIERYVAIVHPLQVRRLFTHKRMYFALACVWLLSVLLNVPVLIIYQTKTLPKSGNTYCYKNYNIINTPVYHTVTFVLTYLLPLLCMIVMYVRVSFTLWLSDPNALLLLPKITRPSQSHSQKLQSGGSVKSEPSDSNLNSARKRTGENTTATSNYGSSKTRTSSDVITLKDNDSNKSNSNHGVNLVRQEAGGNDDKNCSSNDIVGSSIASGSDSARRHSRNSHASCTSSISFSSASGCTSSTIVDEPILDLNHHSNHNFNQDISEQLHNTDRPVVTSSHIPGSHNTNLAAIACTRFLPPGIIAPLNTCNSSLSDDVCTSATATASPLLPPTNAGDGVYVLRKGTSPKASCRYRATSQSVLSSRRKVIRLLIVVLIVFALTVLPRHVRILLRVWAPHISFFVTGFSKYVMQVFMFLNSALNPVLYCLMSDNFRQSTKKVLCGYKISRTRLIAASHTTQKRTSKETSQLIATQRDMY